MSMNGPVATGLAGVPRAGQVYRVSAQAPNVRKNAMVISTGSAGGGGLAVYEALPCDRVYTIFLPMPVANWVLQYCAPGGASGARVSHSGGMTMVHMEGALVPPSPTEKFDFQRSTAPPDKAQKNIVLRGSIAEDGSISNLHIYQGITQEMDETAKLAFNRWKFAPAMRAGKPVAVEILVGIPSLLDVVR
jgi:hypothetical protein